MDITCLGDSLINKKKSQGEFLQNQVDDNRNEPHSVSAMWSACAEHVKGMWRECSAHVKPMNRNAKLFIMVIGIVIVILQKLPII